MSEPSVRSRSVSILIPAYNEAAAIGGVVAGARRHAGVVVIDDGSDDGTGDLAERAGGEVVRHRRRRGKSEALRTGIAAARARGATHVVTLDGDGQHDPRDIPALLAATAETPEAIIVGGRLADARPFPRARLNALRVAGFFVEWASGLGLRDTQSGFRAYPMALFDDVRIRGSGFVFETEVLIAAARRGWRVREVPVSLIPRAPRPSRFRPLGDGIAIGAYLVGPVGGRWKVVASEMVRAPRDRARWRRAAVVAMATGASPFVLALAAAEALLGDRCPDLVTPVVRRVYSTDRLGAEPSRAVPAFAATPAPQP